MVLELDQVPQKSENNLKLMNYILFFREYNAEQEYIYNLGIPLLLLLDKKV